MPPKKKNLSPAKQREAEAHAAQAAPATSAKPPAWASWETKVDRIQRRELNSVLRGWLAHVPEIQPPGSPPREGIAAISAIDELLPRVPKTGDMIEPVTGGRGVVLHEAFYLAHKAIHVELLCAESVTNGLHTWAIVDAYQASLFALGSIFCFLGLTIERSDNDFVLIDVWGSESSATNNNIQTERYHFLRFKTLDHFHKWAILKRLIRTLDSDTPLVRLLREAIDGQDDKQFARHRNTVNYDSSGWLAEDLLAVDHAGPIQQAQSAQEMFDAIYDGTPAGTVYLMCALIELACQLAMSLHASGVLPGEKILLDRRLPARQTFTAFDWDQI
ncbi:hypothetical protein AAB988_16405 [Burkholderia contaminans]|uniref:hypothetical protein n=1 Tax=Burkholderia contaminans TaxID=488447 RepID=UPI00310E0BEF